MSNEKTDRELLELAAKAAGYTGFRSSAFYQDRYVVQTATDEWSQWSPLTDDGDALRLAVKLRLVVQHAPKYVVVLSCDCHIAEHQDTRENNGDATAATRRAIVLAAAAVAAALPA